MNSHSDTSIKALMKLYAPYWVRVVLYLILLRFVENTSTQLFYFVLLYVFEYVVFLRNKEILIVLISTSIYILIYIVFAFIYIIPQIGLILLCLVGTCISSSQEVSDKPIIVTPRDMEESYVTSAPTDEEDTTEEIHTNHGLYIPGLASPLHSYTSPHTFSHHTQNYHTE